MEPSLAQAKSHFTASIVADILLTLVTCGIYNLFIQSRQIRAVNDMLKNEKYSFLKWLLLTIVTCGIYHIYHEYIMAEDINRARGGVNPNLAVICLVLAVVGLPIVSDAIMQSEINKFYGYETL